MTNYATYKAEDFALDEHFQRWVLQHDAEATAFWIHWLSEHPEKRDEVEKAKQLVLTLGREETSTEAPRVASIKQAVFRQISPTQSPVRRPTFFWKGIAACLLVFLLVGGGFWAYQQWAYVHYTTPYGEARALILPDGSEVTLKANSSLRYARDWSDEQDREVWLSGEAFFHVKKKRISGDAKNDQRLATFVVHATEAVDVAVLGTEFNVSTRAEETEVALKSGSVRVDVKHEVQPQTVLMQPGDLVEIAHRQGIVTQQKVDLQTPIAWQDNILIFDEATLATVAEKLQYTYGVEVVFADTTIAQRQFKGFVPTNNLDLLLEAFAELYDLNISRKNNRLTFSQRSAPTP